VSDNGEPQPTTPSPSTPPAHESKLPPPPIQWETEVSTRGREPSSLGAAGWGLLLTWREVLTSGG
jgi:hypothetical protein